MDIEYIEKIITGLIAGLGEQADEDIRETFFRGEPARGSIAIALTHLPQVRGYRRARPNQAREVVTMKSLPQLFTGFGDL